MTIEARPVTTARCADWLFPELTILGKRLEHLAVESRKVIGLATGSDQPVLHNFLIDPIAARVADIGAQ